MRQISYFLKISSVPRVEIVIPKNEIVLNIDTLNVPLNGFTRAESGSILGEIQ